MSRAAAALLALGVVAALAGPARRLEHWALDARFALRGPQPTDQLAVIAIDDRTLNQPGREWPLRRSLHARAIDALRRAGVRRIVYDVQFTEPSGRPREDLALVDAVARAKGTVLATGESDGRGHTRVLGGNRSLRRIGAVAGAANLPSQAGGVIRRFNASENRLDTIATVVAGRPRSGLIDYRGPAGTIDTHSFGDLLAGKVAPSALEGRIVVVGATAPTLQDLHPTSAGGARLMPGPEIQANAIWTALHGAPLHEAPGSARWALLLALGGLGLAAVTRLGAVRGALAATLAGGAYAGIAQVAFANDLVLPVALPLAGLVGVTAVTVISGAAIEARERRRAVRRGDALEQAVRERTRELELTQVDTVIRLAHAAELRDDDTGDHINRMSAMCERVALVLGMSHSEVELLRLAAALHDVGKIGLPDAILNKPGRLTPEEIAIMRRHTAQGAELLDGSRSPLLKLAEVIARTHHEKWDGTGYPAGLKGEQIPLAGRIAAVCDVFDALTSARPYKRAWTVEEACAEIRAQRGRHFDAAVADALLSLVEPPFVAGVQDDNAAASDSGVPSSAASARSTEVDTQVNVGVSRLV